MSGVAKDFKPGPNGYEDEERTRTELVRAARVLYRLGVVELIGHISARLTGDRMLIKPRKANWKELQPEDLRIVGIDGTPLDGLEPPVPVLEWPLHAEVYRARPDVMAVLHAHPTDSVLMASLEIPIEPLTRDLMEFADGVPVVDNLEATLLHATLVDTPELGAEIAAGMGKSRAMILKFHGTVISGRTVGETVVTGHALEVAARIMLQAASVAQRQPILPPTQQDALFVAQRGLDHLYYQLVDERWAVLQRYHLPPGEL
jgi:L-fuculose-phosphate aldolase